MALLLAHRKLRHWGLWPVENQTPETTPQLRQPLSHYHWLCCSGIPQPQTQSCCVCLNRYSESTEVEFRPLLPLPIIAPVIFMFPRCNVIGTPRCVAELKPPKNLQDPIRSGLLSSRNLPAALVVPHRHPHNPSRTPHWWHLSFVCHNLGDKLPFTQMVLYLLYLAWPFEYFIALKSFLLSSQRSISFFLAAGQHSAVTGTTCNLTSVADI